MLADLASSPIGDALTLLRGPRRVGKSVVVRDLVVSLAQRPDVDTRQIIHVPCDALRGNDLTRALTLGRELTRSVDEPESRPRIWLFDEIGSIPGWTAVLKRARDNSAVGDETVVATSSSWQPDENVQGQLLVGRAGTGSHRRIRLLLPMTFRSFLAATRPELARLQRANPAELQDEQLARPLTELIFDVDAYDLAWQAYLTCGGFPRAVAEHHRQGAVSGAYVEDLASWLRDDTVPDERANSLPALLSGLSERAVAPLNRTSIARDLGYTRDAFDRRLMRAVNAFATLRCPQRNDSGDEVPSASAKFYLTDPLLNWLPSRLRAGLPEPDFAHLTEQSLGVALARAVDDAQAGRWVDGDTIGYVRTGSGNEVDLGPIMLPMPDGPRASVPIESKWVERGWRNEAKTVEGRYGRGILATKSILDTRHPSWAVPAPLLALLLN